MRTSLSAWSFLEYTAVRTLMAGINLFPIAVSTWVARRLGEAAFVLMRSRRKVAFENLNIAFGNSKSEAEKRSIALESFRHLATSLVEFFRLPKFIKVSARHVRFKGIEYLDRAFAKGRGVVLVMSHLGPWEYLGFLTYLKKYPTTVLGRPLRNPYFYRWVKSIREAVHLEYSDKALSASLKRMLAYLRQNHLVAIVIDQWAGNEGLWVDFFGRATSTTSFPARLAEKTNCALVPAYCIRAGSGEYQIRILPEVPVEKDTDDWLEKTTQRLNRLLEQEIRLFPEQWMWTHKRWKKGRMADQDNAGE
jgi:KDO2-lipid IV(A) lauroyltransferase